MPIAPEALRRALSRLASLSPTASVSEVAGRLGLDPARLASLLDMSDSEPMVTGRPNRHILADATAGRAGLAGIPGTVFSASADGRRGVDLGGGAVVYATPDRVTVFEGSNPVLTVVGRNGSAEGGTWGVERNGDQVTVYPGGLPPLDDQYRPSAAGGASDYVPHEGTANAGGPFVLPAPSIDLPEPQPEPMRLPPPIPPPDGGMDDGAGDTDGGPDGGSGMADGGSGDGAQPPGGPGDVDGGQPDMDVGPDAPVRREVSGLRFAPRHPGRVVPGTVDPGDVAPEVIRSDTARRPGTVAVDPIADRIARTGGTPSPRVTRLGGAIDPSPDAPAADPLDGPAGDLARRIGLLPVGDPQTPGRRPGGPLPDDE